MTDIISRPHARATLDDQGVACLTICTENHLNILGTPVIHDLIATLQELAWRDDIRVLVLRGQGDRAFVAGANIKEMAQLDRPGAERFITGLRDLCEAVRQFPTPVIARIPGWCLGGGLELALACDVRIIATKAQIGMPEVKVGIPSVIYATLLPRIIGTSRADWMLLTVEMLDASTATDWCMMTKCVPLDELDSHITPLTDKYS